MRLLTSMVLGGAWGFLCAKCIGGTPGMYATVIGAAVLGIAVQLWRRTP